MMTNQYRPGKGQSIDAVYAWVATEPDGGEGIIAVFMPNGLVMPAVGADMDRIKSFRAQAEAAHAATGYPVRLVRFGSRDDLEVLP